MTQTERQRTRLLRWEGCLNARDLGGYPTMDGRETRWGAVVRSDNLAPLTEVGRAALAVHGIRTIVDLRRPDEVEEYPNPFASPGPHGITYTNVPFEDPIVGPLEDYATMADQYLSMLDRFQNGVAAILAAIARAPSGGVLIHCMAGKDRTGLVSAFLLELAGVPREIIGADYALTAECLRPWQEEWLANGPGERVQREQELVKYSPRPEVILEVLADLDRRYGGTEAYLLGAGVSPADIARLRDRLVASLGPDAPDIPAITGRDEA